MEPEERRRDGGRGRKRERRARRTARKHRGDAVPPRPPRRVVKRTTAWRGRGSEATPPSHTFGSEASRSRRCGTGAATAAADLGRVLSRPLLYERREKTSPEFPLEAFGANSLSSLRPPAQRLSKQTFPDTYRFRAAPLFRSPRKGLGGSAYAAPSVRPSQKITGDGGLNFSTRR